MSPASVNGVAEIVYTPFADASSSWFMVLTSLESATFQFVENTVGINVYLAHAAGQPIRRPPIGIDARISAYCLRIRLVRFYPVAIVQWTLAVPARGKLHDPICAFDYRGRTAFSHFCIRSAAPPSRGGRWHVRTPCLSESFWGLSGLQRRSRQRDRQAAQAQDRDRRRTVLRPGAGAAGRNLRLPRGSYDRNQGAR